MNYNFLKPLRKNYLFIIRLLFTLSLLVIILHKVQVESVTNFISIDLVPTILYSVLLLVFSLLLISLRWVLIASFYKLAFNIKDSIKLVFIGHFFNQLLPTSIGGDVYRGWGLWRIGNSFQSSVLTVFLDRLLGFGALSILIFVGFSILSIKLEKINLLITSFIIVSILFYSFFIFLKKGQKLFSTLKKFFGERLIGLFKDGSLLFVSHISITCLSLSLVIHFASLIIFSMLSNSLGANISLMETILIVPTVLLISALPISIGGWGVREAGMVGGYTLVGLDAKVAVTTSIIYGSINIGVGLIGGLLFLLFRITEKEKYMRK